MKEKTKEIPKKGLAFFYEKYMLVMGLAGQCLFYLQGYTIFANHSAQDVSLWGFLFSLVSVSSWLIYGLIIKNKVLITANIVACIGALLVVLGIYIYG